MLDIKLIRESPESVRERLASRGGGDESKIPEILSLGPDVMVVTGDHASPSILAAHGWQPVPVLIAGRYAGADPVTSFSERACAAGTLGIIPAQHLMPLVLANALRLTKFGA